MDDKKFSAHFNRASLKKRMLKGLAHGAKSLRESFAQVARTAKSKAGNLLHPATAPKL